MEEFKKDLALKREARHRAIAAVSSEMERLRRELDAEKEAHYKTLALLRSARGDSQSRTTDDDRAKPATKGREERMRPDDGERESRRAEAQRLTNTLKVSLAVTLFALRGYFADEHARALVCHFRYPTS